VIAPWHGRRATGTARDGARGPGSLRIAVVTEYYPPHIGGICEHVRYLAREARLRGHQVDIITSRLAGREPDPRVIEVGESCTVLANGAQARLTIGRGVRTRLREALARGRYDIVHLHAPLAPTLPLIAIEEATCPVVGTFHAYHHYSVAYAFGRRWFQRRLGRLAACIAVSAAARDAVARYFDAPWVIIPNGVDTDLYTPAAPRPLELPRDAPSILYVGRFDPRNGLGTLIRAFRGMRARGRRARLVVVGDGARRERYVAMAEGDPEIHFVGRVPHGLPGYYAASAILAAPATRGSFGITVLEAMACGTPVVCYDTPGFRTLLRDGVEGFRTPPHDAAALSAALERLLDDAALRRRMGEAGRRRALEFSWPVIGDAVLDVYARVLGATSLAA
jgi:phosphatidylinositol alpha-mannosyltransferase